MTFPAIKREGEKRGGAAASLFPLPVKNEQRHLESPALGLFEIESIKLIALLNKSPQG